MALGNKRPKLPKFVSPRAAFIWPKLHEPDYKFDSAGKYEVRIALEEQAADTQAFLAKLQPHYEAALASTEEDYKALPVAKRKELGGFKARPLFKTEFDEETEEPTGRIIFSFSMKASGEFKKGPKAGQKWTRKPAIFDAKGKPMAKVPDIWGGTIGKIGFEAGPSFMPKDGAGGLKFYLTSAQIIELVQGGERSAKDYGFGSEDGYEHDEASVDDDGDEESFGDETGAGFEGSETDDF